MISSAIRIPSAIRLAAMASVLFGGVLTACAQNTWQQQEFFQNSESQHGYFYS